MIEIALKDIEKYYGANHVLNGVTFQINRGEHLGLLGKNGAGKTTLFKILAGLEKYDAGEKMVRKGAVTGLLDQIPEFPENYTSSDVLASAFDNVFQIRLQMVELENQMSRNDCRPNILEKYGRLQQEFEIQGGYLIEENIRNVCSGLKISEELLTRPFSILSGGEKTRVVLGRLILQNPDILLLDEPTNHLDLSSIEWLERYLKEYNGTVILISHDRYFLDRVTTCIIELVNGKAEFYSGNYSYFIKEKEERLSRQLEKYEQEQKKIRQLEATAKRMHEWANNADNPAMHRKAFNIEKRAERIEKTEKPACEKALNSTFGENSFSGKDVITCKGLIKAFNENPVLDSVDFLVQKSERVAILGKNGSGKSTLFKILIGEYSTDGGIIKVGNSIKYAYLPQVVTFKDQNLTILDTVRTEIKLDEGKARSLLAKYKFRSEDVFKTVGNLSGGEKSRLKLCLLMQEDVNLLLLDEPTNHLDIDSKEWLENALEKYSGTMVFISHDRFFINKFATRVSELENGKISDYYGDYEFFRTQKGLAAIKQKQSRQELKRIKAVQKQKPSIHGEDSSKKFKDVEDSILALEQQKAGIDLQMQQHQNNYEELSKLYLKKQELDEKIEILYGQWADLEC